jgi:phospholipid-binding lipoprotein MlaA
MHKNTKTGSDRQWHRAGAGRTAPWPIRILAALAALCLLPVASAFANEDDPIEYLNRTVYEFNVVFDSYILDPIYDHYNAYVPEPTRAGISNIFSNLREPLTAISSTLAGEFDNASNASARFAINSTVGAFGYFDVGAEWGFESRRQDLGATLCGYGTPGGAYFVLPVIGPFTVRDFGGRLAYRIALYSLIGPFAFWPYVVGDDLSDYVDDRPLRDVVAYGALDGYSVEKRVYLSYRDRVCGRNDPPDAAPGSGDEFFTVEEGETG